MHSADQLVIEQVNQWLSDGINCWLCTIINTKGSSPRPVGSLMVISATGIISGSVSGGCIEEDIAKQIINNQLPVSCPSILNYGVDASENERLGLPCGGKLTLLAQPIAANLKNKTQFSAILASIAKRRCISRLSYTDNNDSELITIDSFQPLKYADNSITHCFGPQFLMLIIGAGQLSKTLAELALAMDYKVVVCDPRPELIDQWDMDGVEAIFAMPDDVISQYTGDNQSVIISLTHVTQIDDLATGSALKTNAFYIGALGSRRTSESRKQRLGEQGFTAEELNRLHAPVGLSIGSKTPIEIAVSIMAQLTALRTEHLMKTKI